MGKEAPKGLMSCLRSASLMKARAKTGAWTVLMSELQLQASQLFPAPCSIHLSVTPLSSPPWKISEKSSPWTYPCSVRNQPACITRVLNSVQSQFKALGCLSFPFLPNNIPTVARIPHLWWQPMSLARLLLSPGSSSSLSSLVSSMANTWFVLERPGKRPWYSLPNGTHHFRAPPAHPLSLISEGL